MSLAEIQKHPLYKGSIAEMAQQAGVDPTAYLAQKLRDLNRCEKLDELTPKERSYKVLLEKYLKSSST